MFLALHIISIFFPRRRPAVLGGHFLLHISSIRENLLRQDLVLCGSEDEMMECALLDWKVVCPPRDDAFRVHTAARRSFQPFFLAQKQNGGIKNTIKQQRSHQSGTLQGRYKTGY